MKSKILIIALLLVGGLITIGIIMNKEIKDNNNTPDNGEIASFNLKLIKRVNENQEGNYLISPYSIEIALNLLKEGAKDKTYEELEKILGNRTINDIIIKDHVSVANAAFIKNEYQKYVLDEYYKILKDKYHSEILYDDFKSPKVINDWVKNKTDGMIEKILNDMSEDFVMGLANAIAVDLEWDDPFDCKNTTESIFTKNDKSETMVEMMHKTIEYGDSKYLKSANGTGIILPYKRYNKDTGEEDNTTDDYLEFVAILPNGSIDDYIDNLNEKELKALFKSAKAPSDKFEIELSLPRFKYDYELNDFMTILKDIGIKSVFDAENANLTGIMPRNDEIGNLYVGEAIHKTHVDLNEKGTKAAAVTYFGLYKSAATLQEKEKAVINFNKPFIYMIRDHKTGEILFFGQVTEPNKWECSTCSEESE